MIMKSLKMKLGVLIRNYSQLHIITSTNTLRPMHFKTRHLKA